MDEKILILFVLPLTALALILGWFILMCRGGHPLSISLKGFGMTISLDSSRNKRMEDKEGKK